MGAPEILILIVLASIAYLVFLAARGMFRWAADRVERDVSAGLRYGPDHDDDEFWGRP